MAAIISQMNANRRAREKGLAGHCIISSDKCVYTLPPFDPCFDPLVHNKVSIIKYRPKVEVKVAFTLQYMRAQAQKMMFDREKAEHEELQRFIRDKQREEEQKTGENGSKDQFLAK